MHRFRVVQYGIFPRSFGRDFFGLGCRSGRVGLSNSYGAIFVSIARDFDSSSFAGHRVEAGLEKKYGDGLLEARQQNLHNALDAIFVAPTFSQLPWYADHPTSEEIRQESHFLKVVIPFVDKSYPVKLEASGRLLLGFSKSGWGAWSLLLRHPDKFGNGVAWDAPLMMSRPGLYGSGEIFGSVKNFENYRISRLLEDQSQPFQKQKRLILLGYGNFRTEHETTHSLLLKLNIPHEYRDGPERKHDWHSGWVKEAAESLFDKVEGTDAN